MLQDARGQVYGTLDVAALGVAADVPGVSRVVSRLTIEMEGQ